MKTKEARIQDSGFGIQRKNQWQASAPKLGGGKRIAATKSVAAVASLKTVGTKLECLRKERISAEVRSGFRFVEDQTGYGEVRF